MPKPGTRAWYRTHCAYCGDTGHSYQTDGICPAKILAEHIHPMTEYSQTMTCEYCRGIACDQHPVWPQPKCTLKLIKIVVYTPFGSKWSRPMWVCNDCREYLQGVFKYVKTDETEKLKVQQINVGGGVS